jgi:hypothetical protein
MLQVKCPQCGKTVTWDKTSLYKPFCSERCRLIDLGEWASEKHAIPGEPHHQPEDNEPSADN